MLHIQKDIKDIARLQKILLVFVEEGFGYYVAKARLRSHLPWKKRLQPQFASNNKELQAQQLRKAFERLGPTFTKLGQLLSVRPDLVPSEFSKEFEKLQDRVPAFAYSQVKKIIEDDFHQPISRIFRSFDQKPIASASIAQVHKAVLKNGQTVAVKVQRPNIKEIIDKDLDILFYLAHSLEKHAPAISNYRPVDVVKEFALWTRKELNFEIEATHAARLHEIVEDHVYVPKIYPNHSSRRVLTMEYISGVKLDDIKALQRYHLDRKKIATAYFFSILNQALIHGFFHADPHPANIFIQKNGRLVFLDYGIVGELTTADRKKIIKFIQSIPEKDAEKTVDIILSLARDIHHAEVNAFKQEAIPILQAVYYRSIEEESIGRGLYKIISLGAKYNVIFDANHVLIAKAIYQAEGLGLKLHPQFNIGNGLQQFAQRYLQENYSPRKIASKVLYVAGQHKQLLEELPEHVLKIMDRLERNEPHEVSIGQLHQIEEEMEYISRRWALGIITAGLLIASSFFFYQEGRTAFFGVPLSLALFAAAILLVLYLIIFHKKYGGE
ncbi:hypothetical protein HYX14_03255 [Candidatus Woesearchaeota archaeon]|nr:hypothetical protein [Candidatus Woesearchaeota archaeon]